MTGSVFISFRRDDAAGWAGRLLDALGAEFRLFTSDDQIEPGEDFSDRLGAKIDASDALLVVIGRGWLAGRTEAGHRRLDDPRDHVRFEIERAFSRGIRVVPVLVDDARMPERGDLPEAISSLANLNALSLRLTNFQSDVEELRKSLSTLSRGGQTGGHPPGPQSWTGGGGSGLGDVLGQLQKQLGKEQQGSGGGLADILGQVLGQTASSSQDGEKRIDDSTTVGVAPLNQPLHLQQLVQQRAIGDVAGSPPANARSTDNGPTALRDAAARMSAPSIGDAVLPPGTVLSAPNDGPMPPPFGQGGYGGPVTPAPPRERHAPMASAPSPEMRYPSRGTSWLPILITSAIAGGLAYAFSDKLAGLGAALLAMIKGSMPPPPGPPQAETKPQTDIVDCSVFAPPAAPPGARIRIQVFLHLDEQLSKVKETALRRDARAVELGTQTLKCPIPRGAEIDIQLLSDGLETEETSVSMGWHGKPDSREFIVRLPKDADGQEYLPKLVFYLDGEPVGSLVFSIRGQRDAQAVVSQLTGRSARRFRKVFLSYSRKDQERVAIVARSYSVIDQEYFQDVSDIQPGEDWQKRLSQAIDQSDLFMLFWSEAASQSQVVRWEVEYALARERETGAPQFLPFPLGDPPPPTPWDIIKHRHIGDPIYFKLAEKRRSKWFWQKGW